MGSEDVDTLCDVMTGCELRTGALTEEDPVYPVSIEKVLEIDQEARSAKCPAGVAVANDALTGDEAPVKCVCSP